MNGSQGLGSSEKGTLKGKGRSVKLLNLFNRSGPEEVDERRIYKGSENPLIMSQKYTHKFQCSFYLDDYPFDRQVFFIFFSIIAPKKLQWRVACI